MPLFPFKNRTQIPTSRLRALANAARQRGSFLLVPSAIKTLNATRQALNREAKQILQKSQKRQTNL